MKFIDSTGRQTAPPETAAMAEMYDAKARDYVAERRAHASFRAQCDLLNSWLSARSGRLLDLGCGSGDFLLMAGGRFRVPVGMDLSFGMLQAAARQLAAHHKTHLTRASATELPFASQSFDAISTMGVAECVGPLDVMLRECHRVLAPGGLLVMTCGHGCCLAKRLGAKLREFCKRVKRLGRPAPPTEVSIHQRSPELLDRMLAEAGFRIRERVFRGVRLFGWPLKDWCPGITYGLEDRVETWPLLRRFKWTAAVYAVCADRV